jgi:hypothetical protein
MTTNRIQRWLAPGLGAILAVVLLSGCAVEGPVKPAGLEQKIENARSPRDHEEIASLFEQQAGVDKAAALRHRELARIYTRSGGSRGAPNPAMSSHCDKLAQTYQQAADENLVLAKIHRQMAVEAK